MDATKAAIGYLYISHAPLSVVEFTGSTAQETH